MAATTITKQTDYFEVSVAGNPAISYSKNLYYVTWSSDYLVIKNNVAGEVQRVHYADIIAVPGGTFASALAAYNYLKANQFFFELASGGGGGLPAGTLDAVLRHDGSAWVASVKFLVSESGATNPYPARFVTSDPAVADPNKPAINTLFAGFWYDYYATSLFSGINLKWASTNNPLVPINLQNAVLASDAAFLNDAVGGGIQKTFAGGTTSATFASFPSQLLQDTALVAGDHIATRLSRSIVGASVDSDFNPSTFAATSQKAAIFAAQSVHVLSTTVRQAFLAGVSTLTFASTNSLTNTAILACDTLTIAAGNTLSQSLVAACTGALPTLDTSAIIASSIVTSNVNNFQRTLIAGCDTVTNAVGAGNTTFSLFAASNNITLSGAAGNNNVFAIGSNTPAMQGVNQSGFLAGNGTLQSGANNSVIACATGKTLNQANTLYLQRLRFDGGVQGAQRRVTVNAAAGIDDYTIVVDSTLARTVTLPLVPVAGQIYNIKRVNTGTVTINGNGINIDGSATVLVSGTNGSISLQYIPVGNQWRILSSF